MVHEWSAVKNLFSTYAWSKIYSCFCEFLYIIYRMDYFERNCRFLFLRGNLTRPISMRRDQSETVWSDLNLTILYDELIYHALPKFCNYHARRRPAKGRRHFNAVWYFLGPYIYMKCRSFNFPFSRALEMCILVL